MTADPSRRRSFTKRGAIVSGVLVMVALIAAIVGVATLRTSEAGEAVETDDRVRIEFPSTPTAAIAVVDDDDRLTSVAVATLDPSGAGGSIVTVPVNFDTTLGFGEFRSPLNGRPVDVDDTDSVEAFVTDLESALRLTIPLSVVLDGDGIVALTEPFAPIRVDLPASVVDSTADGEPELAEAGAQDVDADELAELFTAIDITGATYDHHPIDVALWEAVADAASATPSDLEVPLDEFDRPVDPADGLALLQRLAAGQVATRDLAIDAAAVSGLSNPDGVDVVVLDPFDALLVFAEIAPGLVSTPNESLTFQIIAPFSDEQVADALGDDVTTEVIVRQLISELVFAEGNVVSVQTAPSAEGAEESTLLEVADGGFIDAVEEVAPILFGEVEVVEAARIVDGVDVVAVLGTDFLIRRAEILAGEGPSTIADDDVESIEDLAGQDDDDADGDDESDGESVDESAGDEDGAPDTVVVDE